MTSENIFPDSMTLSDAKALLRTLVDEGQRCPCCSRFAKVYKRKINSGMARALIRMYRLPQTPEEWIHLYRDVDPNRFGGTDTPILRFWGLVEENEESSSLAKKSNGLWRLTAAGRLFVRGETTMPKYARLYDNRCLGFAGPRISIRDALGDKFNYDELMRET
jgi:hypothetical protein